MYNESRYHLILKANVLLLLCMVQVKNCQELGQQSAACSTFRITSPFAKNLHWTAGQCYQVSYDLGQDEDNFISNISVDIINSETMQYVKTLIGEQHVSKFMATKSFNLDVAESGTYHYSVVLNHKGVKCEPKRSVDFNVTVNPNSPPATC